MNAYDKGPLAMQPKERARLRRAALQDVDDFNFQRGRQMQSKGDCCPAWPPPHQDPASTAEGRRWLGWMCEYLVEMFEVEDVKRMVGAPRE